MINPPLASKIASSVVLSLIAIILFLFNKNAKSRLFCMIAMVLSTIGDLFMTNTFNINEMVSTVIGALSFMMGHIIYASMNRLLIKEKNGKLLNIGFYIGIAVTLLPLIVELILAFVLPNGNPSILYVIAIPIYTFVIGYHICTNYSYAYTLKSIKGLIYALSVTLFYVTDIWIFLKMFNICDIQNAVWHFYPLSQLLIILLSTNIKKKDNV